MKAIVQKVWRRIQADQLLFAGDSILIACSGGPDSTVLLDILRILAVCQAWKLKLVYIDHQQHMDTRRVRKLLLQRCRRWKIPFLMTSLALDKDSSEDSMRTQRYRVLASLAQQHQCNRVATGHTRDDQAETILMRILRGTSVNGLCGIPSLRSNLYIRPLLDVSRDEIMRYLRSRQLQWIADPSNRQPRYLRNRIRNQILPLIRNTINPAVDDSLIRLSRSARRDGIAWEQLLEPIPLVTSAQRVEVNYRVVQTLPQALQARLVLKMIRALRQSEAANLEQLHIERILSRLGRSHFRLDLPGAIKLVAKDNILFVDLNKKKSEGYEIVIDGPKQVDIPGNRYKLRFWFTDSFELERASKTRVYFDAQKLRFPLVVRSVRPGDCMDVFGVGRRKVARLFIDEKIDRQERKAVPIVVKDGVVLWVAGIRRSKVALVDERSRRILAIECTLTLNRAGPTIR